MKQWDPPFWRTLFEHFKTRWRRDLFIFSALFTAALLFSIIKRIGWFQP